MPLALRDDDSTAKMSYPIYHDAKRQDDVISRPPRPRSPGGATCEGGSSSSFVPPASPKVLAGLGLLAFASPRSPLPPRARVPPRRAGGIGGQDWAAVGLEPGSASRSGGRAGAELRFGAWGRRAEEQARVGVGGGGGGARHGNRALRMPSFVPANPASNSIGSEGNIVQSTQNTDFGSFEHSFGFRIEDAINLSRTDPVFNQIKLNSRALGTDIQVRALNKSVVASETDQSSTASASQRIALQKDPRTETSTDDTDDRNQRQLEAGPSAALVASDSSGRSKEKPADQKTLRRLAQNREAARKSRLRKKAYVQQLESSRLKLTQLEQELQRARQQGIFISSSGDQSHSNSGNGAMAFDVEYARWLEEQNRHINELRSAVNSHVGDTELRIIVDNVTTHYDDIYRLKDTAAKADVFHILSGMWKTPAERCFMWIGGFRSSELLKLLLNQLEPLTDQQLMGLYNLQHTSQQAEDALSQGMEALQQSLAETLANSPPGSTESSGNVANYMGQMAMAMGKLGTLEGFLRQADNLRQQTLVQMHRILTTRQSARALLAIHDYFSRLRALSSLWLARPRE
ncbi:hypothetical protein NL676_001596 [Syzygium grande]|nr:hypothetical protein NL676_001596 [Syzygium grande]